MEGYCCLVSGAKRLPENSPENDEDQISQRAAIAANATQSCKRQDSGINFEIQSATEIKGSIHIQHNSTHLARLTGQQKKVATAMLESARALVCHTLTSLLFSWAATLAASLKFKDRSRYHELEELISNWQELIWGPGRAPSAMA